MAQLRHLELRAHGEDYTDVYTDVYGEDHVHITNRKQGSSFYGYQRISSVFEAEAELEEHPDIWAAISTVWANRGTYPTDAAFKAAIDAALVLAGYTLR